MKPQREWNGRVGRVWWWLRRGRVHTHQLSEYERLTHSHHLALPGHWHTPNPTEGTEE